MSEDQQTTKPEIPKPNVCLGGRLNQWTFDHKNETNTQVNFRDISYVKTNEFDENGRRIWILSTLQKGGKSHG